jgi:signal transduction histidine kinase/CHASE3 domain sensor protein
MPAIFSKLSIKHRIYIGFISISCFVILISFISLKTNDITQQNFNQYELINEKASKILLIDNKVANLQHIIQEYINTGYESIAEKASINIEELKNSLNNTSPLFENDDASLDYLNRMKTHLDKYAQTFIFAVEEIRNRNQLLKNVEASLKNITDDKEVSQRIKNIITGLQKNIYAYINDPDILLITASLDILEKEIDIASPSLKEKLLAYKKDYIDVVQSTRGYLFLISVVMAGEAQEFKYISTELSQSVLSKTEPLKRDFKNTITKTYKVIIFTSFILILLALLLSFFIVRSINKPLSDLTETFKKLADDQTVEHIPGMTLHDEIGSMSRAADVFRLKNEKTKELVKELDNERSKLQKSNKELEQFAYITSHDLQEPLRTISSFSSLFTKTYGDTLDDKGKDYLTFINEASKRMHSLIHGILEYSRIGKTVSTEIINLNQLVETVLKDLTSTINEKSAEINVGDLPDTHGNEHELHSLFTNLISNALKFVKKESKPHIEIGCKRVDNENVYFVKDNGIGIEPDKKDKVFMIFQRMQDRRDYPGNGIGLAHCKKIIESCNGRIWIESEPDNGCTFFFTIGSVSNE